MTRLSVSSIRTIQGESPLVRSMLPMSLTMSCRSNSRLDRLMLTNSSVSPLRSTIAANWRAAFDIT